jgi:hypothetical protein
MELTERQKDILALERKWWLTGARRAEAIHDRFELSPARFQRELSAIVELDAALSYDPLLVRRLRRTCDVRGGIARHPAGRRLG